MVLNFPVGETVESLVELARFGADRVLELQARKFSGYVVVTLDGVSGIEEGLLFLMDGRVVGCAYSLDAAELAVYGRNALALFFNGLAARHGIVDLCGLSRQQLELILALEEKIACDEPLGGMRSLKVAAYSPEPVRKLLPHGAGSQKKYTKNDLFKRIELTDLFS